LQHESRFHFRNQNRIKIKIRYSVIRAVFALGPVQKENKELLTYLLFEAEDVETYISHVKEEMDKGFAEVNRSNNYFAKKSLRKILRFLNKYIKYTGSKEVEITLLLYFCSGYKKLELPKHKNTALTNLYSSQVKKIRAAIGAMHEDLQHDYLGELDQLT
jgi:hypothetical protein